MYIYLDDKVVKKEQAKISPFDHGYLYGLGVFETFRVYEGHPFLLDDHLERLNHGLQLLNINKQFHHDEIMMKLKELLCVNQLSNAYIRLNVSAGIGEVGLDVTPYHEPSVIIFSKPIPPAGEMAEKEAKLLELRRNTPEGRERLKSHHYLNNILAKREIGSSQGIEGIFLTEEGFLAEGIVSNLFWKKGNVLFTPSISTGILNGITRQFVIELAKKKGFIVKEGEYSFTHALQAEEIFVTNSIQEIVPISLFEGQVFPGKKGAGVQQLHQEYRTYSQYLWTRHSL